MTTLLGVGYWHVEGEKDEFPRPQTLVGDPYDPELCDGICRYLKSGATFLSWKGYSGCRFQCGPEGFAIGHRDLSDGRWVWPEGLPHYVRSHHVRLPEELLETMRAANWTIREPVELPPLQSPPDRLLVPASRQFWIEWARAAAWPVQR